MDFFFVATDEIARKYPLGNGYVVEIADFRELDKKEREELPAILDVVDCRSNAHGTLFGSKQMGDYKSQFIAKLIDSWGRTTVILLTDGEHAITALSEQVKRLRSHATIVQKDPSVLVEKHGTRRGQQRRSCGTTAHAAVFRRDQAGLQS